LINDRVDQGKPSLWRRLLNRLRLRRRKSDEGVTTERREPVISDSGPDETLTLPPMAGEEAGEAVQAAPTGKKQKESEKAAAKEQAAPENNVKISPFKRNKNASSAPSGKANQPSLFDNGEGPIPPITILDPPDPHKKKGTPLTRCSTCHSCSRRNWPTSG